MDDNEKPSDKIARLENEIEYWKTRHMELETELREKQKAVCEACLLLQEAWGFCKLGEAECPVKAKRWPICLIVGPGFRKRTLQKARDITAKCLCIRRSGDTGICPIHNPPTSEAK